ncbi:MAG: Leucine-tRNA ligase, partial [Parcubacteria group bacterium GW2011_GWB1_36_5]
EMFMGPFDQSVLWSTDGLIGPRRFIEKVWRIGGKVLEQKNSSGLTLPGVPVGTHTVQNSSIPKLLHKTIKKVSEDIEEMHFNTAISSMMILATEMEKAEHVSLEDFKKFLQILSPFAPHVAEELWENLRTKTVFTKNINFSDWPKWNENLIKDEEVKIAVQVNGKVRSEIMIQVDEKEENVRNKVLADPIVLKYIEKRDIKKIIYVKNRLINIVV